MERKWMNRALLVVAVGLGISAYASAQTVAPDPIPVQRSYLCFDAGTANEVTRKANEAGARGWRLISASPGERGSIWCFEQLRAARPAAEK